MHQRVNRQVRLKSRPSGIPQAEHFEIVEAPVPDPSNGQVLVRNIYLSVDPAMRGWVSAVANYSEPVALGAVMRSLAVGCVEESRSSDFHPGEYVTGMFGWQDYAVVDAAAIDREVGGSGLPISTSLGVLGLNGLTAYFALLEIGQPKAGETAVVSTAAGAVGSCVGQIAKIKGCRTVGIAGGPDKVRVCREEFRYDSAVDYRADDFESALDAACPEGVDVYFDNTAGPISDSVMRRLNVGARVVICGTASIASWDPPPQGPRVERHLLVKRARMQGFLIFDHVQRSPEALPELESCVRNGQIHYRDDILDGIEQAPGSIEAKAGRRCSSGARRSAPSSDSRRTDLSRGSQLQLLTHPIPGPSQSRRCSMVSDVSVPAKKMPELERWGCFYECQAAIGPASSRRKRWRAR